MIHIDGSLGEGGGQVLRSSLTLSILTGQPVHLTNIRARRPKPGLQAQHLAAVNTAAVICGAEVTGAAIGSGELIFVPGPVQPGRYRADIGTAGATSLVLQTVFLPLALDRCMNQVCPTEITLTGGTHVPWSPSIHYLTMQWLPVLRRLGFDAEIELLLAGFYPEGNGQVRVTIRPVEHVVPLHLPERGALRGIRGISAVANLDMSIAERQRNRALARLKGRHNKIEIELLDLPARNKGTFLLLQAEFKHSSACYVSLGALGKRAEQVADEACLWLERFLESTGAVDEHLADQLLLPLAFAEGESLFRTARVTEHLRTNAEVIRAFGAAEIEIEKEEGGVGLVRVRTGSR
ncbi:MAG: RNA 3'-terminal phosphate cyclase [Anaerolineae bacterium]|nr:RNA 3'-terminal phosphate cyclase [Anaerolineae bacterium]